MLKNVELSTVVLIILVVLLVVLLWAAETLLKVKFLLVVEVLGVVTFVLPAKK